MRAGNICAVICGLSLVMNAGANMLKNPGFEMDFGARQDMNMWGDYGEAWGETYQVPLGREGHPAKSKEGNRILVINVPVNTWNGIWQQVPWGEDKPFSFEGNYLIQGGDLHDGCATFLKAEFLDGNDQVIGQLEGEKRQGDTKKAWKSDALKGKTPAGAAAIRFIVIAGNNPNGPAVTSRIYWDDMKVGE